MGKQFWFPVGTEAERKADTALPGAWVDATGYAVKYPPSMGRNDYHTGADLNLNKPAFDSDRDSPVYAIADGLVVYASTDTAWGVGNAIIVVRHSFASGVVWARYAHIADIKVNVGLVVYQGQHLAKIGNGGGRYPYHLHFDIAVQDIQTNPADWSGANYLRCVRTYTDPLRFIREV